MTSFQERLFAMQDKQYAAFQAKLTPGVPVEEFHRHSCSCASQVRKRIYKGERMRGIPSSASSSVLR